MPLTVVRQETNTRLLEAQTFLSLIKAQEPEPGSPIPLEFNIQKGLFLVMLYGTLEYGLTRAVTETALLINKSQVKYHHIHESLYPLALDPEFQSVTAAGIRRKWPPRILLFQRQFSSELVVINEGMLQHELSNAWAETIKTIFEVFGIVLPCLYDIRVKQYIDEVTEKRNAVSHGRDSAANVGQGYTTDRLQHLHEEIAKQIQHIFSCFETLITTKAFVKSAHQTSY